MLSKISNAIKFGEEGHAQSGAAMLIGAVGAVLLGIGAGVDNDWMACIGGIVLAVGLVVAPVVHHVVVDYDVFGRLEKLEKK